jgi:hypothetical protein
MATKGAAVEFGPIKVQKPTAPAENVSAVIVYPVGMLSIALVTAGQLVIAKPFETAATLAP